MDAWTALDARVRNAADVLGVVTSAHAKAGRDPLDVEFLAAELAALRDVGEILTATRPDFEHLVGVLDDLVAFTEGGARRGYEIARSFVDLYRPSQYTD